MTMKVEATLAVLALLLVTGPAEARKKRAPEPLVAAPAQLIGEALTSDVGWERLVHLCDQIGHRLSGSPQLDQAIAWAEQAMKDDSLANVRAEPVEVPAWTRGSERLTLLSPKGQELDLLALGGSVGTPEGGIEADVVVVSTFDELEALPDQEVTGRMVLFDAPFTDYGSTVKYRSRGPSAAARKGAVAALVRSVTPVSLNTPHTGGTWYADDAPQIPAAAVTIEAAESMHRLQDRGTTPRVRLELGSEMNGTAPSANVVGEVLGREKPDEIVVVGCHLDSWDVGQGAQDDGGGCVSAMEVGRLIARLPVAPRRTVRVVLFTNEENGLAGGKAYAEAHADETHVAAMESDTGQGAVAGFRVDLRKIGENAERYADQDDAAYAVLLEQLAGVKPLLAPLDATGFRQSYSGADIGPIVASGTPGYGVDHDTTGYWPIHHTEADTLDKIDPTVFRRNTAAMAVMTWWLAEHGPSLPGD
jgi:carboxypeptidase Q